MSDFKLNGAVIKPPTQFKPVFSTTSTEDSDRTQDLVMHNTPMGTIAGYDMRWDHLNNSEISTILKGMLNKPSFTLYHPSPVEGAWVSATYYASNFSMEALTLVDGQETWNNLLINVRSISPI